MLDFSGFAGRKVRAAGLGVAMGNAPGHVKSAADRIVADLDHGGCAEAIGLLFS